MLLEETHGKDFALLILKLQAVFDGDNTERACDVSTTRNDQRPGQVMCSL